MDLEPYRGIGVFGPAYAAMLANDAHAPGSVDRVLQERMVLLCPPTADLLYSRFTPTRATWTAGSRPALDRAAARAARRCRSTAEVVLAVARFCRDLSARAPADLDAMRFGGTAEQIIARGSDWCTDVARAACVLYQVAGLPSRLVYLADTARAYCGHAIVEVFHDGRWGAADASTAVVYRDASGRPATTWQLMHDAALVAANAPPGPHYSMPEQFRAAAVANYFAADRARYDYTVSRLNAYCRSILEQAEQSWPGGLRWLHGEDEG